MPGDFDLNERAVLAMMQRLTNNLESVIEQINTERGPNTDPPYSIDPPVVILPAPPVQSQLVQFPIVAIADGNIHFEDDVGWGATGIYEMIVLAYIMDPDPVALAWKLRRYAQAIATVALYGRNVDGGAWGTILKKIVPGARLSRQDPNTRQSQIMQWVAVILELKDEQNTP